VYFLDMQATLSQLHRETRRIVRPVIHGGEEVVLTDFGKPVARIVPYMPTITVSPSQARESGTLDDDRILAAIIEAREDESELPVAP
jgi:antitoxin (DNA-binding transcriptional repressor) of toxin-antitoxin stability system